MKRFLIIILIIALNISCKKKITNEHKEFVGSWDHRIGSGGFGIFIGSNGSGYKYELKDYKTYNIPDSRNWYIRNDKLIWRPIFGESYNIDMYPTTAETDIDSFSGDTIKAGQRYMKLAGNIYIERL